MVDPHRDEHYWLGSLAMTVAVASVDQNPRPILRTSIKEFLAECDPKLAQQLREAMRAWS